MAKANMCTGEGKASKRWGHSKWQGGRGGEEEEELHRSSMKNAQRDHTGWWCETIAAEACGRCGNMWPVGAGMLHVVSVRPGGQIAASTIAEPCAYLLLPRDVGGSRCGSHGACRGRAQEGAKQRVKVLARCSWVSSKISTDHQPPPHTTALSAEANPTKPVPQLVIGMEGKMHYCCCGMLEEARAGAAVQRKSVKREIKQGRAHTTRHAAPL
jgi:hypothetical protein